MSEFTIRTDIPIENLNPDGSERDFSAWASVRQPFKAPEVDILAILADIEAERRSRGETWPGDKG